MTLLELKEKTNKLINTGCSNNKVYVASAKFSGKRPLTSVYDNPYVKAITLGVAELNYDLKLKDLSLEIDRLMESGFGNWAVVVGNNFTNAISSIDKINLSAQDDYAILIK